MDNLIHVESVKEMKQLTAAGIVTCITIVGKEHLYFYPTDVNPDAGYSQYGGHELGEKSCFADPRVYDGSEPQVTMSVKEALETLTPKTNEEPEKVRKVSNLIIVESAHEMRMLGEAGILPAQSVKVTRAEQYIYPTTLNFTPNDRLHDGIVGFVSNGSDDAVSVQEAIALKIVEELLAESVEEVIGSEALDIVEFDRLMSEDCFEELVDKVKKIDTSAAEYLMGEAQTLDGFNKSGILCALFMFDESPQGSDYWLALSEEVDYVLP